jgi:hypothetical protein
MTEDDLAIVVLAHGGWSAAWAWKKVRPLMAAAGHFFFTRKPLGIPTPEKSNFIDRV